MSGDPDLQKLRWSVRRLIELIDEGIDSAGEQLSRSESYRAWRAPVGSAGRDESDQDPRDHIVTATPGFSTSTAGQRPSPGYGEASFMT
jgi:hypothetical protein